MTQVVIYAANFHLGVIQLLRSHLGKDVLEKKGTKVKTLAFYES